MRILLVRHGLSKSNVDKTVHQELPDHAIGLTPAGFHQAQQVGNFLEHYFSERAAKMLTLSESVPPMSCRLWVSPYERTRETADGLYPFLSKWLRYGCKEHFLLGEQQFGLFDGLSDEQLQKRYPEEHEHYDKCEKFNGRFWARMPLGESRFDVAKRVHQAFGTFHRDRDKHGIDTIIVVTHGVVIRAFVMAWCHLPFQWFEQEANPNNCSVRLIEDGEDKGYIFDGFPRSKE